MKLPNLLIVAFTLVGFELAAAPGQLSAQVETVTTAEDLEQERIYSPFVGLGCRDPARGADGGCARCRRGA